MTKSSSQADAPGNAIRLETTAPLKINLVDEEGNPLRLTLEEGRDEDKKPIKPTEHLAKLWNLIWSDTLSRITLVVLGASIAIAAVLSLIYSQTYVSELEHSSIGVDFAIKYCPWLTLGDENSVEITLVNKKDVQLERVKAYLVFSDTLPIGTVADGSNTASFDDLAPGECKTRIIKLLLPKRTSKRSEAILQIEAKDKIPKTDLKLIPFTIPRMPYLKTLFKKLTGGFILVLTLALGFLIRGDVLLITK